MSAGLASTRKNGARKKFAILLLIEPGAFEIEQRDAGELRERKRVNRKLREGLVGGRVGFVIEDVDRAISDLETVDVAGDDTLLAG